MIDLFNTITEVKLYVGVNSSLELDSIRGKFYDAARKYIIDWLGETTYNDLVSGHAASTLSPQLLALLPYAQRTLANFGLFEYIPISSIQMSETGINRAENDHFKTAFKYQVNDLKDSLIEGGFDALELMLSFLEKNKVDYPDWETEARAKTKELFINSAKEFKRNYDIIKGRLVYDSLRPLVFDMECFAIIPNIGDPYFDELKDEILNDTLTPANIKALKLIQKALAYFTIREAVRQKWGRITPNGFQSFSTFDGQGYQGASPSSQRPTQIKIEQGDEMGNRNISKLLKLMIGDSANYPTFNTWYDEQQALKEAEEQADCLDNENPILCDCDDDTPPIIAF